MFTGLIEKKGVVLANNTNQKSGYLSIATDLSPLEAGESIAVNGVCLTVLPSQVNTLHFDVSPETLACTALAALSAGESVHLERAMSANTRFGSHYVSGHVDKVAHVALIQPLNEFLIIELAGFNAQDMFFLIPKGSITVNGVSLTINKVIHQTIQLMLVPHTLVHTNLGRLTLNQHVNIEFDYLTRIVAHQLHIAGKLNNEVIMP